MYLPASFKIQHINVSYKDTNVRGNYFEFYIPSSIFYHTPSNGVDLPQTCSYLVKY